MRTTDLPIPSPCHADWDAMRNEGTRRFCDSCVKHVHDLSAMTRREASKLLAAQDGGRICVRYTCDTTGTIKFKPESAPVVPIAALTRRQPRRGVPLGHAAAVALALAACTPHERDDAPRPTIAVEADDPAARPEVVQPHVFDGPREIEMKGEVAPPVEPAIDEPCDPEPEPALERPHVKMGKIAPRVVEPPPAPAAPSEEIELMGDVAIGG
jgi:hypothetical protein